MVGTSCPRSMACRPIFGWFGINSEWLCLGRASALAEPGDYAAWEIAGQPAAVVRDRDGQLRAFSNVCLHRMSTLLHGRGRVRAIVCPYHAWTSQPGREVRWRYWRPWHASDADAFMARRGEGPWTRWLAEHQVVTGVIEGVRRRHTLPATPPPATTLVANTDNLKDYEAYRALDPATAHMRIANWVGGVLPSAPRPSRSRTRPASARPASTSGPRSASRPTPRAAAATPPPTAPDPTRRPRVMSQDDSGDDRTGVVRLSGRLLCASAEEADVVRRHLPEHVRLTRAEPGCLSFEVTPTDDPLTWRVEERFTDRAAFDAHQRRTRASAWGAATAAIRRDYEVTTAGRP